MFKRLSVALVALLLALVPVAAFAQTGITLQTGFQVQNLGTGTATVTVTYYNADGTVAATQVESVAAGASYTYFGATMEVPNGFRGSVVISADQPIAAVSNVLGTNTDGARTQGSYNGFSGGATAVSLPLIQRGNAGIDSFVAVQNAGQTDAQVQINFIPGLFGTAGQQTATIKPGAAFIFDQATFDTLGARFVGSANLTSTNGQPLVATVSQVGKTTSRAQSIYDGFTAGSPTALLPLIQAFNGAGQTFVGIQVQNAGTQPTNITITFTPNSLSGCTATPPPAVQNNVAAGASFTYLTNNTTFAPGNCRYVGSATVTNSANQPLVAVVNQLDNAGVNRGGSSYEGFNPTGATRNLSLPLLQANNSGIFSGIQIQNTTGTATDVTITFSPNTLSNLANLCSTPAPVTRSVPANASINLLMTALVPTAGCRYVGSAAVVAATQNVVAVTNQLQSSGTGDTLSTYNAFNQ